MRSGEGQTNQRRDRTKEETMNESVGASSSFFLSFSLSLFHLFSLQPSHTHLPSLPAPSRSPPFSNTSSTRLILLLSLYLHSTTRLLFVSAINLHYSFTLSHTHTKLSLPCHYIPFSTTMNETLFGKLHGSRTKRDHGPWFRGERVFVWGSA